MQKPHTLTISDYDSKTHAFHYEFTCPGYEENEDAPCALATQCEKCDEKPDPETTERTSGTARNTDTSTENG